MVGLQHSSVKYTPANEEPGEYGGKNLGLRKGCILIKAWYKSAGFVSGGLG